MANTTKNRYEIRYGSFEEPQFKLDQVGDDLSEVVDGCAKILVGFREDENLDHIVENQLLTTVWQTITKAGQKAFSAAQVSVRPKVALTNAASACAGFEQKVMSLLSDNVSADGAVASNSSKPSTTSFAEEFYTGAIAAHEAKVAAQEKADKDAKDKADAEAKRKEEEEEWLKRLFAICPEAAALYNDRMMEAEFQAQLEHFKGDPEMYEIIKKQYEAWKKAKEEAAKLAEQGIVPDEAGLGADDPSGGLGSDLGLGGGGSGFGGGDLDLGGGSDFGGGGGGLGDLDLGGSDWASEDWASDLLEDGLDAGEFLDAEDALAGIAGADVTDALAQGADALGGGEAAEPTMMDQLGERFASAAMEYGLQASLVLGGAAALYLTREQTTEAVAHVAEFVSTKCRPAVDDVMDQVRGAAKKTRVNLGNARSNVTAAVRGERAGDLVG